MEVFDQQVFDQEAGLNSAREFDGRARVLTPAEERVRRREQADARTAAGVATDGSNGEERGGPVGEDVGPRRTVYDRPATDLEQEWALLQGRRGSITGLSAGPSNGVSLSEIAQRMPAAEMEQRTSAQPRLVAHAQGRGAAPEVLSPSASVEQIRRSSRGSASGDRRGGAADTEETVLVHSGGEIAPVSLAEKQPVIFSTPPASVAATPNNIAQANYLKAKALASAIEKEKSGDATSDAAGAATASNSAHLPAAYNHLTQQVLRNLAANPNNVHLLHQLSSQQQSPILSPTGAPIMVNNPVLPAESTGVGAAPPAAPSPVIATNPSSTATLPSGPDRSLGEDILDVFQGIKNDREAFIGHLARLDSNAKIETREVLRLATALKSELLELVRLTRNVLQSGSTAVLQRGKSPLEEIEDHITRQYDALEAVHGSTPSFPSREGFLMCSNTGTNSR